ncbi:NUDIX domain-containing protein [Williamsia sp. M5A3_1d]
MANSIRPIVLALIRRPSDGALLVTGHGIGTDDPRVRPLGGGIEFGETARTALDREITEELGITVSSATLLGVFENLFTADDENGHEIVFAFDTEVQNAPVDRDRFPILDAPHEIAFWWHPTDATARLVPAELGEYVERSTS